MALLYGTKRGVREVVLTFDDGPNPKTTPRLLDILAKYDIKAVFFVVGNRVETSTGRNIIERAHLEGHIIGNHSFTHPNLKTLSEKAVRNEILKTHNLISDFLTRGKLFRPPYGATNTTVSNILKENGYMQVLWSVDTLDWNSRYKKNGGWVEYGMNQINDREDSIVLMHDIHSTTVNYVERLIERIKRIRNRDYKINCVNTKG